MWTATCSGEFYRRYIQKNEEQFSDDTKANIAFAQRQSSLSEYASLEA